MEAYPPEYVEHNLPLVFLSGLGERSDGTTSGPTTLRQESGTRIATISGECKGDRAAQLLDSLLRQDGSQQPWNSDALPGPSGPLKYRMKAIGRVGMKRPAVVNVGLHAKSRPDFHSATQKGCSSAAVTQHRTQSAG